MRQTAVLSRTLAAVTAVIVVVALSGCGSEVEGNPTEGAGAPTATGKSTAASASSGAGKTTAVSSTEEEIVLTGTRSPLVVTEDLGLDRRIGAPESLLSRCTAPMQEALPRLKAAALFRSSRGGLLVKFAVAGKVDPTLLMSFTFASHGGKNVRVVGLRNGVVAQNSATLGVVKDASLKGEHEYRGWVRVETSADGVVLWVEIPEEVAAAYSVKAWTATVSVENNPVGSCSAGV